MLHHGSYIKVSFIEVEQDGIEGYLGICLSCLTPRVLMRVFPASGWLYAVRVQHHGTRHSGPDRGRPEAVRLRGNQRSWHIPPQSDAQVSKQQQLQQQYLIITTGKSYPLFLTF